MKLLIASDIHGSAYWCSKLMDAYQNEKADRMILLGDILYHGPRNALPKEYDPQRVCDLLNQISDRILCVRGNCDADVDQWLIHFPIMADYSWIMEKDRVIYLTHGHVYGKDFRKDEAFRRFKRKMWCFQVIHIFRSQNRLTEGYSLTRVPFQSRKMEAKMVI